MDVLIIEDETPAAKRLQKMILQAQPGAQILDMIETVEKAVDFLRSPDSLPDLIFMDIQLADGMSFEIFPQVEIRSPIIFTTAYDQYTLKAFKVNSIDYLLKPIDPEELKAAFQKYDQLFNKANNFPSGKLKELIQGIAPQEYKERFLIKVGQQLSFVNTSDICYFFSENGLVYALTAEGKKHHVDYTLEQVEERLDPKLFFRINRKVLVAIQAIHKIAPYFNNRLALEIFPKPSFDIIVSRDRVHDFKRWLDR